jgi:hypothetical protein
MKKIVFVLSFMILTSPAYAVIYKWLDQTGTLNFSDDDARVPSDYRNSMVIGHRRDTDLHQQVTRPAEEFLSVVRRMEVP